MVLFCVLYLTAIKASHDLWEEASERWDKGTDEYKKSMEVHQSILQKIAVIEKEKKSYSLRVYKAVIGALEVFKPFVPNEDFGSAVSICKEAILGEEQIT